MTAQTTYSRSFTAAFAGQLGDGDSSRRIVGKVNGSGSAFSAGVFAAESTTVDQSAVQLASTNDEICGLVLNTFARNPGDQSAQLSATQAYLDNVMMPVLERGTAWAVKEAGALAVGDDVYVRFAAGGGGSLLGAVRADADTASARQMKGCRVMQAAASADTLVLLQFDVLTDHATRA